MAVMLENLPGEIRMVAFDVDGTLFSSESIIFKTYVQAIEEFAHKTGKLTKLPSHDQIMMEIGKPVREIFANLLPDLPETEREGISSRVLDLLCDSIRNGGGDFYAGVGSTIHYLKEKGYTITCASNGRRAYVETVLDTAGVLSYFEPILVINQENICTKGDIITEYIKKYNFSPDTIVLVGDRYSDWEAARKNGCRFGFCSYGHATSGEIPDFEWEFKDLQALKDFF
ncbi:HAD family hydrolase [Leptospira ognonensis]|uniref:phosphoglycolate phosphatase n=2 Tax=Leptospira ognonensis TaxID=2484945 RepID=A0A4R9JZ97_9LEPT|nr:HAD hydrolase-like protein [Leptospira ognonensis]TGL57565.1 HAD family hydrolase [Leptospira ognonensis]